MGQNVRNRRQNVLKYVSNGQAAEGLSRGMIYRELYLRLKGQIAVAAIDNTTAKTKRGDEWGAVKEVRVIANGTDVIFSVSGNALWWMQYFFYGAPPAVTPTLGDATTLNPSFDSTLIIPFWMPLARRPIDTALDSRRLSSLEVEVTWGSHTDINASATGFTTEPTITLYSLESFNVPKELRFSQFRRFNIEQEVAAANPRYQVTLPTGPMYRGFLINASSSNADVATILNNVRIVSGSTVYYDMNAEVIRQVARGRHGLHRGFSGAAYDDIRIGDSNDVDGWHFINLVTDGLLTEAIDTLGFSEFQLELDVSNPGTDKINVYPLQVIPVRG